MRFRSVYTTAEDCNCSCSHDTVRWSEFDTLQEAIDDCSKFKGEPHAHTVVEYQSVEILDDEGEVIDSAMILKNVL